MIAFCSEKEILEFFKKVEEKWQKIWEETKIYEPKIENKPKFFLTVPYPYMSGLLHIGNGYTFSRGDFIARFKRLKGYNVLWPMGWHITGAPIVSKALRLREKDPKIIKELKDAGIPESDWEKLKTPEGWALYFIEKNREAFKRIGFSIDWRREFYTSYLNPWYSKFIEWQYIKLKEKGLIAKGKHPVVWDPKVNVVIGDHDRPDEYAGIGPIEGCIIKFKYKDIIFPAFTLRPETIYGVTNIWVNPDTEYVIAKVNEEKWILPNTIVLEELKNQGFKVEIIEKINIKEFLGKNVINPINNEEVPILPAKFVDTEIGTGIVMSVPAHAPYDYIALIDIINGRFYQEFKEIAEQSLKRMKSLFKIEGYSEFPAKDIVERKKIESQEDKDKLEKATQEIYSKEFYEGILKDIFGKYSGKKICEIKEEFEKEIINKGIAIKYYTLPIRFKSRYGGKCVVKIVENQWFLRYSDEEWKKLAHECVDSMEFVPEDIKKVFHQNIDWLKDWACAHQRELGTPLPWDPEWTLESLSDSTIYMIYYTVAHLIKNIPPEKIDYDLFDYIFLGKGDKNKIIEKYGDIVEKMKKEVEYWYPVDLRTSGKDLLQNHLIFFIFHHAAIFPKKYWPKRIAINGFVLVEGKKMSKSLGNYITIRDAISKYSADILRFLLAYAGNSGLEDANIELNKWKEVATDLYNLYKFSIENYNTGREEKKLIDEWFENIIYKTVKEVEEEYEKMNFKNVIVKGFYELRNKFKWYMKRVNNVPNKEVLNKFIEVQVLILYPIVPHICSEILEKIKGKDFALRPSWISIKEIDEKKIKLEDLISKVREDIIRIKNIAKKEKINKIKIIIASKRKYEIFDYAKEIIEKYGLKDVIKKMIDKYGKESYDIAKKIFKNPGMLKEYLDRELEIKALEEAKEFLEREFNAEVIFEIEEESKEEKAKVALPGKPAIVLYFS